MIPTVKECLALMDQYQMLENIKEHSIVVAKVVRVISVGLIKADISISLEKALAGALLHDIGKTPCLQTGGDHAAFGRDICVLHELNEITDIVGEHVRLRNPPTDGNYSEKEIVYYADKRVLHCSIVSLEERMHDILRRYGGSDSRLCQRIRENFAVSEGVERELFSRLDFGPDDVAVMIKGDSDFSP